ncbi:MAG: hypothetical protein CMG74_07680 [Candidatus Marinimicrobia bacterium]|nr:hypothetical protein [Candidatus Neomarinimicrobiota bacterium]
MKTKTVSDCQIIKLPLIKSDRKGSMTPVYNNKHIPFQIQRVYYLYDIPSGAERGGHAHKELQQLIVSASGSFNVEVNDGKNKIKFKLDRPSYGLYLPPMIWRELKNFSGGAICLVLASLKYDENDYFRNYKEFIRNKWKS